MNYKLLGKSGLRVSELCLGTMTFGTEWGFGADYEDSKSIFDTFVNAGGNFIDTANRYTEGTSEKWLGEFIHQDRDKFVVATKYSLFDRKSDPNFSGNHRKNMMRSVEGSLQRLNTPFIDLLWLHAWDNLTPVDEVMRGLDDLIRSGKVNYIGISDTPAWVVSQANTLAELRGWSKFVALQVEYSLIQRTPERDLIPMAKSFELALTSWGAMAGGALSGKYLRNEKGRVPENSQRRTDRANKIAMEVVSIADKLGAKPTQVALNWVRQQYPISIPIVGSKNYQQLLENINCINFTIPKECMDKLNEISKIDLGFPHDFLLSDTVNEVLFGGIKSKIINHRI
ncbi:MAG: aldo/keto reductase [Bacteroidota bacterium]|nr:aldo/keto reductase [Bacteroidota bacterium]